MINELTWDSGFFKRKIGELQVAAESAPQIETAIEKAKDDGFKYIICRVQSQQTALSKHLESLGFYLSDIGVIWEVKSDKFVYENVNKSSIKVATDKDIPMFKEMIKSLFLESRFYSDPFFSKEEGDNLYQAWIENSIKGNAADVVFCIPNEGFITCIKSAADTGEIALIGTKKGIRGTGAGAALMAEAMKWFKIQGVNCVSARTQLKNLNAMNFYLKLGFYVKGYDIIFAKTF